MTEDIKNKIKMVTKNDDRFHLAKHVVIPNSNGCFEHNNMWFFYSVDEKAHENICGPFTVDGLIYALALEYDTTELVDLLSFSEAEWNVYYNNHFYSMENVYNSVVLRESIKKNEFISFLRGDDGYQNNDRFNPHPITYEENLISLYELMQNEDGFVSLFVAALKSIGTDCEGIYIVAHYLYILIYHIHEGICPVQVNYKEIIEFLSDSIADKKDILVSTTKLSRLCVNGRIYEILQRLDHNCYADNNEHLFYEKESSKDIRKI